MKNKILVTGGCGLIGSHIAARHCAAGDEVMVVDNHERSTLLGHTVSDERTRFNHDRLRELGIRVKCLDITKPFTWEMIGTDWEFQPDYIFHMAAQCGVPTSIERPVRDFDINANGTLHMLEFARQCGAKVVYASTNKVYPLEGPWGLDREAKRWRFAQENWREHGFPLNGHEELGSENLTNRTPYGVSKYTGDLLCQEYHYTYGVPVGIFRMSCIYGDYQFAFEEQGWATWFVIAALTGRSIKVFGDGNQVRDMLYVGDLVELYDHFIYSKKDFGVWNTGGGPIYTLSVNECIKIVEEVTGEKLKVSYHDWRPSDQRVYVSDIRPLYEDFGWQPVTAPYQGLQRVYDWAKDVKQVF
jgi:CDP-paratose 2-epimerase